MNEESKRILYKQLVEMNKLNTNTSAKPILEEKQFMQLSDKEILKYIFEYRDNEIILENENEIPFIELPDMNLEGQDLSDLYLSYFIMAIVEEKNGVVNIVRPSNVNLKDTGAVINLSNIAPNKVKNEDVINEYCIDFSDSNFTGCELYGILPDEYGVGGAAGKFNKEVTTIGKEDALDKDYLDRRKEKHLTDEKKKISDRAYERLCDGKTLSGMRNQKLIDLTDYDLSFVTEEQLNDIIYRNIKIDKAQTKRLFNLLYPVNKARVLEQEYKKGNIDFVKKQFKHADSYIIGKDIKGEILKLEYEKGNIDFVEEHFKEVSESAKLEILKREYEKGNIDILEKHFNEIYGESKIEILKRACEKGNIEFVKKHFNEIISYLRDGIIIMAYEKGYIDFVKEHFEEIYYESTQGRILKLEFDKGNIEFVKEHFNEISMTLKDEIVIITYEKGDIDFVKKHFEEISESAKIEIVKSEYEKGNIEFVKKYKNYAPKEYRELYQKELVQEFLKEQIGLDEIEIINLEKLFESYGRNVYKESIHGDLEVKKEILDAFGATWQGFTSQARILTNDPRVLYARAKFFQELGIAIDPDRLFMTLGISRKNFDKKYGRYITERKPLDDFEDYEDYSRRVRKMLLSKYPMPYRIEDIKKGLGVNLEREEQK